MTIPAEPETTRLRRAPQMPGHWRRGNMDGFSRGSLHFHRQLQQEYGDVAAFRLHAMRILQVTHPDDVERVFRGSNGDFRKGPGWMSTRALIGDGLITTEPKHWLARRRALQPAFVRSYHEQFAQTFAQTLQKTLPRFEGLARAGEPVSVVNEMGRLTMSNAVSTLLQQDISDELDVWMEHTNVTVDYVNHFFGSPAYKRFLGSYLSNTRHGRFQRSKRALQNLNNRAIEARLRERERGEESRTDLLSQLLFHPDRSEKRGFSPQYVRDEVMTFLFAAHETTAMTSSWAWWFLSQHPEIEARLHEEVDRVLDNRAPGLADLEKMPYGRMIIEETLRLRPPVWNIARSTTQDEVLGGYTIPRNTFILMIPWLTHRHPDFWDEPEAFVPERFSPERSAGRHAFAYVPFGGGPRQCVGRRTALIETHLALSTIAQHFTLRTAPGYVAKELPLITLRPSEGLPMVFRARSKKSI